MTKQRITFEPEKKTVAIYILYIYNKIPSTPSQRTWIAGAGQWTQKKMRMLLFMAMLVEKLHWLMTRDIPSQVFLNNKGVLDRNDMFATSGGPVLLWVAAGSAFQTRIRSENARAKQKSGYLTKKMVLKIL